MRNIFLIGFMGSGKSTISAYMAKTYGMKMIELDEEIVHYEGMSIPEIFDCKGEAYFREMESKLLKEYATQENQIISCGGGVVLREQNIKVMKETGKVVLLTAEPETILNRVKDDDNRPLLRGNMNVAYIQELLDKRRMLYEEAADIVVKTDHKDVKDICKEILE